MSNDVVMVAMKVTPACAQRWLSNRSPEKYNRAIDVEHVKMLAREMTEDRWRCTHQAIRFTDDGMLSDGQHRLIACVSANKSAWLRVVYRPGTDVETEIRPAVPPKHICSDDVGGPIDCGKGRSAFVIRGLQGDREFGYERRVQAIVNALDNFETGDKSRITAGHIDAMVARFNGGVEWAAEAFPHNIPVPGVAAMVVAWQRKSTRAKVVSFSEVVADKVWHTDTSGMAYKAFEIMKGTGTKNPTLRKAAMKKVLRCAMAYCKNESISSVPTTDIGVEFFKKAA
jgi:hypothetical protein